MSDGKIQDYVHRNRAEIAWGVLVPAVALVVTLFTWGHGVYVGLLDRISTLDSLVAANSAHRVEHDASAERWIAEIITHREQLYDINRAINRLQKEPDARPDPYTGSDAKRFAADVARRFRELEARLSDEQK